MQMSIDPQPWVNCIIKFMHYRQIVSRILIALVAFWNILAGVQFIANPKGYAPGFALPGYPGELAVQAVGLLFIMWTIPYLFAFIDPTKNRLLMLAIVVAQSIGVIGEIRILLNFPADLAFIRDNILRFLIFDGSGLILLLFAFLLSKPIKGLGAGT